MNITYTFSVILLIATISSKSSDAQPYNHPLFISCGLRKSATANSETNRVWTSDDDHTFAPSDLNTVSSAATATATDDNSSKDPPSDTARIFHSPLSYHFSLTPGPKLLRLYFTTSTSYNNISPSQFYLSLHANHLTLFKNFSPFLNSPNTVSSMYEFHLTIEEGNVQKNLNLTFYPGDGTNSTMNRYGFVNAIEIVPIPQGLYINLTDTSPLAYVTSPMIGYIPDNKTALQNLFRLNVGGASINPGKDSGSMWRTWYVDKDYLVAEFGTPGGLLPDTEPAVQYNTKLPRYVAPGLVYATVRTLGPNPVEINLQKNLTWRFDVDPGFDYLVRLHYCEMDFNITGSSQRVFAVYINNQTAEPMFDVWEVSGGRTVPIKRDYVIRVDVGASTNSGVSAAVNSTKVPFWLALHPCNGFLIADVLLNGLEIFKLSDSTTYNLAAPNPPQVASPPTPLGRERSNHHHSSLAIIGGATGGAILVSLLLCACLVVYKRRENKEDIFGSKSTATNTSSKFKWIQTIFDSAGSVASTVSSSLPSDLCRQFTLAQIRVATCDFDDNLIIGKGGFGKVYKGTIMDGGSGTTQVAVKRLNITSKQGAHEFQNEIEMLSRLRHKHLVSLIGYCEDHSEMILVYEYMPRGSLRDHLMYKNPERNNDNDTNTPLSWKQRLMTCVGAARGLHYLHAGARQLIIHRDVKSTNILLDDNWTAKVSDFGLSKAGPIHSELGPTHISTAVKGSAGYLDPEYYQCHRLTEKSDVYSFGVVLFEVLCARAAVNPKLPKEQANLAMWARNHYKRGILHTIVDPNLTGQVAPECLRKFGEIAEMCVRDRGSERPLMGDVVWGLEFASKLQQTADSNNIGGGPLVEDVGPTSANLDGGSSGNTDNNYVFSTSGDNFSLSNVGGATTNKLLDSRTTTSNSSDCVVDMKSDAIFSEIVDPTAR